jgi:glycosyltransferase involved in cell wall biosynthesis
VALITVPSLETKRHLQEATGITDDRVAVVMNPLAATYISPPKREDRVPDKILMFGGMANKNLPKSLAAIKDYGFTVLTAGPLEMGSLCALETEMKTGLNWLKKEPKDAAEMREVYLEADILLFCSTFEGFGLPIIEAQACGTLVVTSDRAPMNDISGDGAVLAVPESSESIREAVKMILVDSDLRTTLRKEGLKNIQRFLPNSTSERFAEIYRSLTSGGGIFKG